MIFFACCRRSILVSNQSPATSRWLANPSSITRPTPRVVRGLISTSRRALSAATATSSYQAASRRTAFVAIMGVCAVMIDYSNHTNTGVLSVGSLSHSTKYSSCDARSSGSRIPSSGDVLSVGKITKEPATSIPFPALCNGMSLAGVGVRVKFVFVNVYAVGAYFDPISMMAIKKGNQTDIEKALLDPTYPRTVRIVMNRGLSMEKFINAIVESIEPRLKGQNLDSLEKFKELFPKVDLVEGDEVELTIRGELLMLKTSLTVGTIECRNFTEALCDVYFGDEAVSPTLKVDVLKGIPNL